MAKPVYWVSDIPTHCDITRKPITDEFIDGKTIYRVWAIMHPDALEEHGVGLGQGKGQRYRKQPNWRWLKVEG